MNSRSPALTWLRNERQYLTLNTYQLLIGFELRGFPNIFSSSNSTTNLHLDGSQSQFGTKFVWHVYLNLLNACRSLVCCHRSCCYSTLFFVLSIMYADIIEFSNTSSQTLKRCYNNAKIALQYHLHVLGSGGNNWCFTPNHQQRPDQGKQSYL